MLLQDHLSANAAQQQVLGPTFSTLERQHLVGFQCPFGQFSQRADGDALYQRQVGQAARHRAGAAGPVRWHRTTRNLYVLIDLENFDIHAAMDFANSLRKLRTIVLSNMQISYGIYVQAVAEAILLGRKLSAILADAPEKGACLAVLSRQARDGTVTR